MPSEREAPSWSRIALDETAALAPEPVLRKLASRPAGLSAAEAAGRLREAGPNRLPAHRAGPLLVLLRQLRNPLLLLLLAAALTSIYVGQHTDAAIVLAIVGLSVGLGFFNEYRSERAVAELRARITHHALVLRDGVPASVDVAELVPGDVVRLQVGDVVPADLRLLRADGLECDEAVLSGEPVPAAKTAAPAAKEGSPLYLPSCAFMGTLVRSGAGEGVVVETGARTAFGRIAGRLGERAPETAFQAGLRGFSMLLVRVAGVLCLSIFGLNLVLGRGLFESALFALAIAVGLTPQLLPAIVTVSLSFGARRLAASRVLVKRLVSIEDLGNLEVLFTDKTGTLTEGRVTYRAATDPVGRPAPAVLTLGLVCRSGANPLDQALWEAAGTPGALVGWRKLGEIPFDHDRRLMSVLAETPDGGRLLITKGAPEAVLERCASVPAGARENLDAVFGSGARVVAVATRTAAPGEAMRPAAERELELAGLLCFEDAPKASAKQAIAKLRRLGVRLKIITGDNELVAAHVCEEFGLEAGTPLTGAELEALSDQQLTRRLARTTVFARVTPEQKARIVRLQRSLGADAGFLGDGVNDALALHEADVGISVDSGTDVAKDAADIILLEKDLSILADGIHEGRRIFANTIKYVLMGTSSNFGNMFSAAGASLFLPFLPMTPTQILLNNLLYDVGEMTIPSDRVDEELLARPAHWDIRFIRRFMVFFGPVSSLFDFLTFGVMLWVFHAAAPLFQTGWFVESLATQTLVIFVIRTRRLAWRSRPSAPLLWTSLGCVAAAVLLPFTPLAAVFGFRPLPPLFFLVLAAMIATYLGLVELGKRWFYGRHRPAARAHPGPRRLVRRTHRMAGRLA